MHPYVDARLQTEIPFIIITAVQRAPVAHGTAWTWH